MNDTLTPHAWVLAGYSTTKMRDVANELSEEFSGVLKSDGRRSDKDLLTMKALEGLAVAADHIDRLHQDLGPQIISTSTAMDGDELYLFGVDPLGAVWQYAFNDRGWLRLGHQALQEQGSVPDNVTKLPSTER